jgi:hypothetical protein
MGGLFLLGRLLHHFSQIATEQAVHIAVQTRLLAIRILCYLADTDKRFLADTDKRFRASLGKHTKPLEAVFHLSNISIHLPLSPPVKVSRSFLII